MTATSGLGGLVRVLAWRRLTDRPARSCLTAAGVAVGVAFLFSILSLNAQLSSDVRDTAAAVTGPRLLQVLPASPGGLPEGLADQLATDSRVAATAPLLLARTVVSNGTRSHGTRETGVFVLGATADIAVVSPAAVPTVEEAATPAGGVGLVVSRGLADRLHAGLGDEVALHASAGITAMPVAAIVSSPTLDRVNGGMAAAMLLPDAQQLFGQAGRVDQILVLAEPDADLIALRRDLAASLDGVGLVGKPGETMGAGSDDFATVRLVTDLVGMFVVLAALVLVFHTMSMATAERRTEIALARSLGSSRRQLLLVTLTEAGFLGVAGTTVGLVLGGALARLVVPLARVSYAVVAPVDVPTDVTLQLGPAVVAVVGGVAGAVLGAVVPAWSAARAAPIDAFRPTATYEWRDPNRSNRRLIRTAVGVGFVAVGLVLAARPVTGDTTDPMWMLPAGAVIVGALILVPVAIPFVTGAAAALVGRLSTTTGRLAGDAVRANPRRSTVTAMALLLPLSGVVMTEVAFGSGLTTINRLARAAVAAPLNVDAESYVGGPGGSVATQPLAPGHQQVLEAVPGVRAVLPYENAYVSLPDDTQGVVYAIPLAAARRAGVSDMVQVPRLADDPAAFTDTLVAGQIAASHFAARSLDLEPGSRLTLPTPRGPQTFTVGALFDDWAFQGTFYVDLDAYRATWGDPGAHRYAVVPTPGTSVADLHRRLDAVVSDAAMPADVKTRAEAVEQLEGNTTSFLPLVRGMTVASLVFAGLALANTAYTSVTERRWHFALQQTLGMTRRQIVRSLAVEAVVVGIVGTVGATVVGVALGAFWARFLGDYLATTIGLTVPWGLVALSALLGVAVAVLATHHPRRVAKRLTIVESLRFD